jgi:hypothetical protein
MLCAELMAILQYARLVMSRSVASKEEVLPAMSW